MALRPPKQIPPEREPRIEERIVARLRRGEDGALSNDRVEQYALLVAEEVVTRHAAWVILMSSAKGRPASGSYQAQIHKSPAFKARVEELVSERLELDKGGVWGRLEWQARQVYRKSAALNDLKGMQAATDTLLKIAMHNERAERPAPAEEDVSAVPRGPGAPAVETPDPGVDALAEQFLSR